MKNPERVPSSKKILVINNKLGFFSALFDETQWEMFDEVFVDVYDQHKVVLKTSPTQKVDSQENVVGSFFDPNVQSQTIKLKQHVPHPRSNLKAIFLHFSILGRTACSEEEMLLSQIRAFKVPIIAFALGNTPENLNRAIEFGASGLLFEEEYHIENYKVEIEAIITSFKSPRIQPQKKSVPWDTESRIKQYLAQPTVCFRHWKFFGKTAFDVFEPDTLQQILYYDWQKRGGDLIEWLRIAIFNAQVSPSKSQKIGQNHLPIGYFWPYIESALQLLELESVTVEEKARYYLHMLRLYLKVDKTLEKVAERLNTPEPTLKEKIQKLKKDYPKLLTKQNHPEIFDVFKVTMMVAYAKASKEEANALVERHLNPIDQVYSIEIFDYHRITGENLDTLITKYTDTASVFIFLICPDFLNALEIREKVVRRAIERHTGGSLAIFPIHLKDSALLLINELSVFGILPDNGKPVLEQDMAKTFNQIALSITERIEQIWGA